MTEEFDGVVRTVLVRVYGTVQGVGYRAACVRQAPSRQTETCLPSRIFAVTGIGAGPERPIASTGVGARGRYAPEARSTSKQVGSSVRSEDCVSMQNESASPPTATAETTSGSVRGVRV